MKSPLAPSLWCAELFRSYWGGARSSTFLLLFTFSTLVALIVINFVSPHWDQHYFSQLADAFLHGRLNILTSFDPPLDLTAYQGKLYLPLGPFPAVLLMPIVAIFSFFHTIPNQAYLSVFLVPTIFYLAGSIAFTLGFSSKDSLFAALLFVFSSSVIGVAAFPSYVAMEHLTVSLFLLLAIREYQGHRRWWLIGIFLSAVMMTRLSAVIGGLFFALMVLAEIPAWKKKVIALLQLGAPVLVGAALLGIYNLLRFGSAVETGYAFQIMTPLMQDAAIDGLLSIRHIPHSLYQLFFHGLEMLPVVDGSLRLQYPFVFASLEGTNIFIFSPWLFSMFLKKIRGKKSAALIVTIAAVMLPLLLWFGGGWQQIGNRFSLDYFPFIFFLFLIQYLAYRESFSRGMKWLIIASTCFNMWLVVNIATPYLR